MKDIRTKRWRINKGDSHKEYNLIHELGVSSVVARLMINRNITDLEEAKKFLSGPSIEPYDPFLLKDMINAVEEIEYRLTNHEPIVIYGDYDVDGITATSLLYRFLKKLGANVTYYIPERQSEGYGLNLEALETIIDKGTKLIITVDCGISSYDIVEAVRDKISIIITDHHLVPECVPRATAVINHKQLDCDYPDKNLSGVGVAFKVCQAIWLKRTGEWYFDDLDIVALGTVADMVPLVGENRAYVAQGLTKMAMLPNEGLRALIDVAGLTGKSITSGQIAFSLAPRLNAAGRVTHATRAVELLIETDYDKALMIAEELQLTNLERQELEHSIHDIARDDVVNQGPLAEYVIVVAGEEWHPGVIGIVASRLVEEYYKPTLVISVHDGIGKGSCRSIDNFNIYEALQYADDLLIQFGGHNMAAGFSIKEENIPLLRSRLTEYCHKVLKKTDYIPVLDIDLELPIQDIDVSIIDQVSTLEPYGIGNRTPIFSVNQATVKDVLLMGKQKNHCKIVLETTNGTLDAIAWNADYYHSHIVPGDTVNVAFSLQKNEWQGYVTPQLMIQDIEVIHTEPITLTVEGLRDIYVFVRHICKNGEVPKYVLETEIVHKYSTCQRAKSSLLALEVFKELGILKEETSEDGILLYKWYQAQGKLDLVTSLTFLKYSSQEDVYERK